MTDLIAQVVAVEPRIGTPDDLGYVLATWERNLRGEYPEARDRDFSPAIKRALTRELQLGGTLIVAPAASDSPVILGWLLRGSDGVVVFCYVRRPYRHARIATRLLQAAGYDLDADIPVAHMTDDARQIKHTSSLTLRHVPRL